MLKIKWLCSVFVVLLATQFGVIDIVADSNSHVTMILDFDGDLKATSALGEPEAFVINGVDRVPGVIGDAVVVQSDQVLRYETTKNLPMNSGTISMWVRLNWTPPNVSPNHDVNRQIIWMAGHTRYKHSMAIYVDPNPTEISPAGYLVWEITSPNKVWNQRASLKEWDDQNWHHIVLSWEKPGNVVWYVDGVCIGRDAVAPLPVITDVQMRDMYFGSNVTQNGAANRNLFDGAIDQVRIYNKFNLPIDGISKDSLLPRASRVNSKETSLGMDPEWMSENQYRIHIELQPTKRAWTRTPVSVEINFDNQLSSMGSEAEPIHWPSVRLVKINTKTGKPIEFDKTKNGNSRYYHPFTRVQMKDNVDTVSWVNTLDQSSVAYTLYFDTEPIYEQPEPLGIPMVGNGDRLRIGSKSHVGALGVGAWGGFDMYDFDGDGDDDLWINSGFLVRSNEHLRNGHEYFENLGFSKKRNNWVFKPRGKIQGMYGINPFGPIHGSVTPQIIDWNQDGTSDLLYVGEWNQAWAEFIIKDGKPAITTWHKALEGVEGRKTNLSRTVRVDWDNDGLEELVSGEFIYPNLGSNESPRFDVKHRKKLQVDGGPIDLSRIGGARPYPVDLDQDGDMDLVYGGTLHWLLYFENVGTSHDPRLRSRGEIKTHDGLPIEIPSALVSPIARDFDRDGDIDLLFGNENGQVGLIENIAGAGNPPAFAQTKFLLQEAPYIDVGTIAIPVVTDWDEDGDFDIIVGSSDQYMRYIQNLGSNLSPIWADVELMEVDGNRIVRHVGADGSVQGRYEQHWAYSNPEVADWDGDGRLDLLISGTRGDHLWYRNEGLKGSPSLSSPQYLKVQWGEPGVEAPNWVPFDPGPENLVTVWRSRPVCIDWYKDGVLDYVALDHEGDIAIYQKKSGPDDPVWLKPGKKLFEWQKGFSSLMIWNRPDQAINGKSGRTVLNLVDWDDDGDHDLITDGLNARLFENVNNDAQPRFIDRYDLVDERMANHNSGPDVVDFDGDGHLDLLIGAEDGHLYYFHRSYIERDIPRARLSSPEMK